MDEFPDENELADLIRQTVVSPEKEKKPKSNITDPPASDDFDDDDDIDALEHLHDGEEKENRFKRSLFSAGEEVRTQYSQSSVYAY